MNNKIIKTIDEHNIDRDAYAVFAFDLEGSEYVSYRIGRDEEQDNLFVSKVVKNIDGTFNMINIEDSSEKDKLNKIVMALVKSAIDNPADKLVGDSVTLSDGKVIKFISVNFNKEQKIEVKKTYVTTVKKEISRVAEKYYAVEVADEPSKVVDDIFPTVMPVQEEITVVPSVEVAPVVEPTVVAPIPVVVETPVIEAPVVMPQVAPVPPVTTEVKEVVPTSVVAVSPTPVVVEPITVPVAPEVPVTPVQPVPVVPTPVAVAPEPVPASVSNVESRPLVFNAAKESNLNAALGEVASTATLPVDNIEPVREFGVDSVVPPVVNEQPAVAPMVQPEVVSQPKTLTKKAGFANSKFFMVVAIAFFLASCIFLGYEVFNYFQLTK